MDVRISHIDFYNKMEELREKLRKSEEERMLLQRQFDLLLQATQEKEKGPSSVEARYRRYLAEDKRRRDRNSSLLQALDRIDSHTASLAAKTERMRMLRKHYEAFIAHAYPSWHLQIERSYCPLASLPATSSVLQRIDAPRYTTETQLCFPELSDHSSTQYHDLPVKARRPLPSPITRSELSLASRDDYPVLGRSSYRTGSAAHRSASLSPSRVGRFSSQYDEDSMVSPRNYNSHLLGQTCTELSPRVNSDLIISKALEPVKSPRSLRYVDEESNGPTGDRNLPSQRSLSSSYYAFDNDRGNSEADQNTSGDFLNLSNLSLSDDGILHDPDITESPSLEMIRKSYNSPRDLFNSKKSLHSKSYTSPRSHFSPRESCVNRVGRDFIHAPPAEFVPKSIVSPRERNLGLRTSMPISDSIHRILLSPRDVEISRTDLSLSPRRPKPSSQTLRHSYLQPCRSAIRRTVTFTEPEYGYSDSSKYLMREEDPDLFVRSPSSLRRPTSISHDSWELTDHERYLREKQGREKDAFHEKIQRLKDLIQENKEHEVGLSSSGIESKERAPLQNKNEQKLRRSESDHQKKLQYRDTTDYAPENTAGFRGSSVLEDLGTQPPESSLALKSRSRRPSVVTFEKGQESEYDSISDKEQVSDQFGEKDEDVKEINLRADSPKKKQDDHDDREEFPSIYKYRSKGKDIDRKDSTIEEPLNNEQKRAPSLNELQSKLEPAQEDVTNASSNNEHTSLDVEKSPYPDGQRQQEDVMDYSKQPQDEEIVDYGFRQEPQPPPEQTSDYGYQPEQRPVQGHSNDYIFQKEQPSVPELNEEYSFQPEQQTVKGSNQDYVFQQEQQSVLEPNKEFSFQQEEPYTQEQSIDYGFQPDQQDLKSDYNYSQNQISQQDQGADYSYQQENEPQQNLGSDSFKYEEKPQTLQDEDIGFKNDSSMQPWEANESEENLSQKQPVSYGQEEPPLEFSPPNNGEYTPQDTHNEMFNQSNTYDSYPVEGVSDQPQSSYETYQQSPTGKDFAKSGSESFHEESPQKPTDDESYPGFTGETSQYPQDYQNYTQDQYNEPQNQTFESQGGDNYQFGEDPTNTQYNADSSLYQYKDGEYNYQQNPSTLDYTAEQKYVEDQPRYTDEQAYNGQQYVPDANYRQDSSYSNDQPYLQAAPDYQQDPQQDANYQQEPDYPKGAGYQESQQYGDFYNNQQAPEELSESTTESSDNKYLQQQPYQASENVDQQNTLDQYRNLLGADTSSEPAYSDASEIENQMAAVVGQGENTITKVPEPVQPIAAAVSPTVPPAPAQPPSASPAPTPVVPKSKAGVKKKPQFTRKQSSISPDGADSKQQLQASSPSLSKMPESASESSTASK